MKHHTNITQKLTLASPKHTASPTFTQKVMDGVGKTQIKLHAATPRAVGLLYKLRTLPIAMLAAIALVAVASTAYAISYILPLVTVNVTKPTPTPSGRQSVQVFSNDCPDVSNKKYELKKVAPFGPEKIADVIKAECNLESIRRWADTQFPELAFNPGKPQQRPDTTPGKIFYDVKRLQNIQARQVKSITPTSITYKGLDEWNPDFTQTITQKTKFIVDHQYKTAADIKPGDAVAHISIYHGTEKNNDDCTPESCGNAQISMTEELLYLIKLDQPYQDYNKFGSLSELMKCPGNETEYCHTGNTASIDIYDTIGATSPIADDTSLTMGMVEGAIQSHNATQLVIKTAAGRTVQITTPYDVVQNFNATRAANYNTTIQNGDTIAVTYLYHQGAPTPNTIKLSDVSYMQVLIEINSKADLTPSAVPSKY